MKKYTGTKSTTRSPVRFTVGVPPIKPGTLSFTFLCVKYMDNGKGQLRRYRGRKPIGTVDYKTGEIVLDVTVEAEYEYVPEHLR